VRAELADLAAPEQRTALALFLVARFLLAAAAAPAAAAARPSLSERHLNLHPVKSIVVAFVQIARRTAFARLPLRRQAALDAAPLGLGAALGLRPIDDLLFLVHADDHVADHLV